VGILFNSFIFINQQWPLDCFLACIAKSPFQENELMKPLLSVVGVLLLVAGASTCAVASPVAPEIPVGSAGSAIALVSGMLLLVRGRRK
jgi:hypothetical protein